MESDRGLMRDMQASFRATLWVGVLAGLYLAVLPMSGTIALRNLVLALLLVFTFRGVLQSWRKLGLAWPVVLWGCYVLLFPLFAEDSASAWQSLASQWGRSLLALIAGAGVATVVADRMRGRAPEALLLLALASAIPLLIHLCMLGAELGRTGAIPWGNWGRERHHADLGYAAGHAVILLTVLMIIGAQKLRWSALLLVVFSLLSLLLAGSRAGLLFGVLIIALGLTIPYAVGGWRKHRAMTAWVLVVLTLCSVLFAVAFKVDPRWERTVTQANSAWAGDAIQIECEGQDPMEVTHSSRALMGDGVRILLLRAGLDLALQHPWGLDGSKQAYQRRLRQVCATPAFLMEHTHNGWLDTALAIGWAGAALYLLLLLHFLRLGWMQRLRNGVLNPWALVLVFASLFWILRGMLDSVYRDHMLEMQGFLLAYAAMALRLGSSKTSSINANGVGT
jgi:O-antigen ligase